MTEKYSLEDMMDHSSGWDWENQHVSQAYVSDEGISYNKNVAINDIVESGTVLIAAAPSDFDAAVEAAGGFGVRIVPIGLVESATIGQSKPLSRIFEIGSKLSYIIPGRTVGGINLNRVFFDGPSLLKAVYMGEVTSDYATTKQKYAKFASSPYNDGENEDAYQEHALISSGNLGINLASTFFDQPVGLVFFFQDQQKHTVGQVYFEGCRVSSHNMGIQASMNVLTEAISMEFVRCRPVVTGASNMASGSKYIVDRNIVSATANSGQ